jgi:hypothetical protein
VSELTLPSHTAGVRETEVLTRRRSHPSELDGEALDPSAGGDLRRIITESSAEPAFEIQRELAPGDQHTLQMGWSMPSPGAGRTGRLSRLPRILGGLAPEPVRHRRGAQGNFSFAVQRSS